ncbi:glycerophosphodiester phosphodiesterase family protein [Salinarimonas sp.]|uniref:glycerophosphodiester phosphodiesterase family protein n=1 Tax=Salinarimonas sp. TaxID=2766526 RepID=UPI0032D962FA
MSAAPLAAAPDWLTARPIAHRGLHDRAAGVIENSLAAARAAAARGFSIECDVQDTADGEAMVFHDYTLERLVGRDGVVRETPSRALAGMALAGAEGEERVPSLAALLEAIGGRVPLVVEIKSRFDGDMTLAARTVEVLSGYSGRVAVKSFDPAVVAEVRRRAPHLPRGIVAEAHYVHQGWRHLTEAQKHAFANLLHWEETRPHFLSWHVADLPSAAPHLCRRALGLPVMAWTVRTADAAAHASTHADQIVFEGFDPA